MSIRRRERASILGFVTLALIVAAASCTGSPGQPSGSGQARGSAGQSGGPSPAACTRTQISAAVARFFDRWNQHDAAAFGRIFDAFGALDMATKHQDTLAGHEAWVSSSGRNAIAAFAARQWRLGERLSYRGISVVTGGGSAGNGGYAGHVVATFHDGTLQPMEEAKFVYDCASHAFAHVVIVSAKAAQST